MLLFLESKIDYCEIVVEFEGLNLMPVALSIRIYECVFSPFHMFIN